MQTDKEYAQALFELAREEGQMDTCRAALHTVRALIDEHEGYIGCLSSPAIALVERLAWIAQAFGSMPEYVVSFLKLLCENGRISLLRDCVAAFDKLAQAMANRVTARIVSVVELDGRQKQALCRKLEQQTGKTVEPIYTVDPALLGGICVEIDGKVYDGSVRSRLWDIKDVMGQ